MFTKQNEFMSFVTEQQLRAGEEGNINYAMLNNVCIFKRCTRLLTLRFKMKRRGGLILIAGNNLTQSFRNAVKSVFVISVASCGR